MEYTERAETAAASCSTSHASAVSTPLRWTFKIKKQGYKKAIHSCRITCEHSESARERRIALYKSDPHTHTHTHIVQELCESRGGRPGLSVLTSLLVSVDVKLY